MQIETPSAVSATDSSPVIVSPPVLAELQRELAPTRTGILYRLGLLIVAVAMVLLPLIYMALIVLVGWGVWLHLTRDTWLLESRGGGVARLIAYVGPALVGGILVFFMVKPFFARRAKGMKPFTLDPEGEPLLFEFVNRICGLVGAPRPCRIDVDGQVNASAGLKRGIWSSDLVLTIGMPLVAGLNMREFAGVLAHEFGHFAQGAGMRLTYVIRSISFWFARVVYERDSWDEKLEETARNSDWRIGIILHGARGCVWVTRRILWALMQVGNGVSCFMLRQMEYDADSYEAKLSGSDTFQATATRLRLLNVASELAYEDVRQSWVTRRLPEDLTLLMDLKLRGMTETVRRQIEEGGGQGKTGWFDTHPCDADRNAAVRRLNEPGVFRGAAAARELFSDFVGLSKEVTRHQYEHQFELEFSESNLMSTEEIQSESAANEEAGRMFQHFYGGVRITAAALLRGSKLEVITDAEAARAKWKAACDRMQELRPAAEGASAQMERELERLSNYTSASHLNRANFVLDPKEFGLRTRSQNAGEQEVAAENGIKECVKGLENCTAELQPFVEALQERVGIALALALEKEKERGPGAGADHGSLQALLDLLVALSRQMARLHEMGRQVNALGLLGQNRSRHAEPAKVDAAALVLAGSLSSAVSVVQSELSVFSYPFTHPSGAMTVARFARYEGKTDNEMHRAYAEAGTHLERLFTLYPRVLGKVLGYAYESEKRLSEVAG